ncbi:hypothetical protein ACQPZK_18780 [Micromonospora sp. CA-249363]|uniref:hypothetical protein n=1 Tax=Micromonospora sp. CA-249363 TaxID=3239963 RepID=UPI003D8C44F8
MAEPVGGPPLMPPSAASSTGPRRHLSGSLRWLADGLAVVGPDPDGAVAVAAAQLPAEPGVVTVVGEVAGHQDWRAVTEALPALVRPGTAVRLGLSGAGTALGPGPTPESDVSPAAALSRLIQTDVYAPDGPVLLVPGGTLYAPHGWRRFGEPGSPAPTVLRHPRPDWEREVDTVARHTSGPLRARSIPAGLWLHRQTTQSASASYDDPVYAIPVDDARPVVVVGRPGLAPPDPRAVRTVLDALDPSLLLTPYGVPLSLVLDLATELAGRWGRPVEVATGLPTVDDRALVSAAVDPDGLGWWVPPASRLRCAPGQPPVPIGPPPVVAGLPPESDAFRLGDGWVVEPTAWGLWVRPPSVGKDRDDVRQRPTDGTRLTILVGLPGQPPPPGVRTLLSGLVARLTPQQWARTTFAPVEVDELLGGGVPERAHRPQVRPTSAASRPSTGPVGSSARNSRGTSTGDTPE